MDFNDIVRSRRSIRRFEAAKVDPFMIREIIETARLSPSAKNRQPWFFESLSESAKEQLSDDLDKEAANISYLGAKQSADILRSAPAAIAVYAQEHATTDLLSIGAAMYAMCLKATDLGLGSLWIGDTDILLQNKKYSNLIGVVAIGYAAEYPQARPRKSIADISNLPNEIDFCVTDDMEQATLTEEPFVFISYSHMDKNVITVDVKELKSRGIPLWYDSALIYGEKWNGRALDVMGKPNCAAMLLYISYHSLSSNAVYEEFLAARDKQTTCAFPIIPIVIGSETIPQIVARIRKDGETEKANAYDTYFGNNNQTLYIVRSRIPKHIEHVDKIAITCHKHGIIDNPHVYDNFSYLPIKEGCVITGYKGVATVINVPKECSGVPVVEIGENAFSHRNVDTVIIPNTVKRLGLGVFLGSTVKEVVLPDSIEEICTACFRDCTNLQHIHLPPRITYLAEALFRGCSALQEIEAPDGVVEMKEAVFRDCSSLKTAVLPKTMRRMTEGGFYGCSALTDLTMPAEVVGAEIQSFDTCPLLNRVTIGDFVFEKGKGTPIR